MTKALYIECNAGISGDMTLGALIDLGADLDVIKRELSKLHIHGEYSLVANKTQRSGISGTDLDVVIKDEEDNDDDKLHQHHEHNSFSSIRKMIENSRLNPRVKKMSTNIFSVIAKAEAAVHETTIEKVVFHEVGAVDSILDIVGTAIAVDLLDVDRIYCSRVHDGTGFIECRHGTIPVPVPAVMEMMKNSRIPIIINEQVNTEMVTPTGFGILEGLNATFTPMLEIKIEGVGYGFGNRDTGLFSAVRISRGEVPDI